MYWKIVCTDKEKLLHSVYDNDENAKRDFNFLSK